MEPTAAPREADGTAARPDGARRTAPSTGRPAGTRRPHPSHGARVVALVGSVVATVGAGAGMAYADHSAGTTSRAAAPAGAAAPTASSASAATGTGTGTGTGAATYADGVYAGASESTRWGDVQVQVTIKSGKIVSVQEIQAPSDGKSQFINGRAQPILQSEAIAQQNANLDIVSGATYTSRAYAASLQAALDKAAQPASASA